VWQVAGEPRLVIESNRVHDQRIAFPHPNRMPHPCRLDVWRMWPPIKKHQSVIRWEFKERDQLRPILHQNPKSNTGDRRGAGPGTCLRTSQRMARRHWPSTPASDWTGPVTGFGVGTKLSNGPGFCGTVCALAITADMNTSAPATAARNIFTSSCIRRPQSSVPTGMESISKRRRHRDLNTLLYLLSRRPPARRAGGRHQIPHEVPTAPSPRRPRHGDSPLRPCATKVHLLVRGAC
jgi:hypothetical protein